MINIIDCIRIEEMLESNTWRKYSMKIVLRDEDFTLFAESEEMMNHWIRLIKRCLLLYFRHTAILFISFYARAIDQHSSISVGSEEGSVENDVSSKGSIFRSR